MALAAADHPRPIVIIVYMTVLYDPNVVLAAIREEVPGVPIVGASTQGISRMGAVAETDRVLGISVICSDVATATVAFARKLSADAFEAGRSLAEQLGDPAELGEIPLLVWFDPLTGANAQGLIDGLAASGYARLLGGAAGQPWGPFDKTYQYINGEAMNDGVVALKLQGLAGAVWETSHGVEPLGLDVTVTEAAGNVIQKLDGKPALDVWSEQLLGTFTFHVDDWTWVLGVRVPDADPDDPEGLVSRGVFGINKDTKEITLLAPIALGSTVHICHRTVEAVFDRAIEMGKRLKRRLEGRSPLLVLSFECGGRPRPFLGDEKTLEENCRIQELVGTDIPWLGMFPWGEIAPRGGSSHFSNFQFPLLVLCA